jgi:hypothetical protein
LEVSAVRTTPLRITDRALAKVDATAERHHTTRQDVLAHWVTLGHATDPDLTQWTPPQPTAPTAPGEPEHPVIDAGLHAKLQKEHRT